MKILRRFPVRPEPVEGRTGTARSWFDRLTTNGLIHGCLRSISTASASLGIALGRRRVEVARLARRADGWRVERTQRETVSHDLFRDAPTPAVRAELAGLWQRLCDAAAREYLPVQVALPDPAVSFSVFEVEQVPKSPRAQRELAAWLFTREHHLDAVQAQCACQGLGDREGGQLLLGLATDRAWIECVAASLDDAGIVPWTVDALANYRFNALAPRLANAGGGLIAVEDEFWTLSLWDTGLRPRYVRSWWRDGMEDEKAIAAEAERAVRAWVASRRDVVVSQLYVTGGAATAVAEALDARLAAPAVRIALDMPGDDGITAAAVAGVGR
jgi:hypothetical protein